MPTICQVGGVLISPEGVVLADVRAEFAPEDAAPRPASAEATLIPRAVAVQTGPAGEVSVGLVPGRYVVRAAGSRTFFVTVPDAPVAVLAQIQDLPAPPSLTDAEMAVLAANQARDDANDAAGRAETAAGSLAGAVEAAEVARDEAVAAAGEAGAAAGEAGAARDQSVAAAQAAQEAADAPTTIDDVEGLREALDAKAPAPEGPVEPLPSPPEPTDLALVQRGTTPHVVALADLPAGMAAAFNERALVFDAGGDNDAPRPAGAAVVFWRGVTAQPANLGPDDLWWEPD